MENLTTKFLDWYYPAFAWKPIEMLTPGSSLLSDYTHVLPWTSVVLYLAMVWFLPGILQRIPMFQKGLKMKLLMAVWNVFLTVFSLIILLGVGVPYTRKLWNEGLFDGICDLTGWSSRIAGVKDPAVYWAYWFALSKYFELVDTLFLILKNPNRPVAFLHWFHHATVLLFTWYAEYYTYSAGFTFITMNAFIHTFMYFYYFLKELDYNPSWALLLTIGQISQMIFGIIFNGIWAYQKFKLEKPCGCERTDIIVISAVLMYSVYLYLFLRFFVRRYITGELAPKTEHKGEKDKKQRSKKDN